MTKEKPFELNPYQDKFIFTDARYPALISAWGTGKRIDIEQEIKTTQGWKKLKDIVDGDIIYGFNGKEVTVIKSHPIVTVPIGYELNFSSGEKIIADPQHLWFTISASENRKKCGSVKTTKEIIETIRTPNNYESNHRIPIASPIRYSTKKLPIEPYTLGAWLGDGSSYNAQITSEDIEVLENIGKDGYVIRKLKSSTNQYYIGNGANPKIRPSQSLQTILRKIGVLKNKHIPEDYMNGNIEQRMELLRGLMDTDGCADKRDGACEFTSVNKKFAYQVCELINSLGIKSKIDIGKAKINGRYISEKYRIIFKTKQRVFKLSRKQKRIETSTSNQMSRRLNRWIVDYKIVNNVKMRCLTVNSSDGLFLVGRSFIATHNTMSGIMRGMILSEQIPNNTGLVVRKSFADLKDSTIKDFTRYTGLEVPSNKNVTLPNGSLIMFRHGDELDVLKNINLGWFFMEQAEEFESDEQFQYLRGRLRLAGIPIHTGFVIGNVNGHNWVWELWKKGNDKVRYPLWEATSFDNAKNLPADTIEDWKEMRVTAPSTYNRFVMNDWEAESGVDWLIPISLIEQAEARETADMNVIKRIISIDPARGGDTVGIMGLENTEIIAEDSFKIMGETKTMEIVGKAMVMREKIKATTFIVDEIGIGAGVKDRLQELKKTTPEIKQVIGVNSGMPSSNPNRYFNVRSEMWWLAGEGFREGKIKSKDLEGNEVFIPMVLKNCSKELKKQLSGVKYEIMDSRGKIRLEPKKDIISRLGHSPDEGDTYVQGIYGLRFAPNLAEPKMTTETQRFWDRVKKERDNIRKRKREFIDDDLGEL